MQNGGHVPYRGQWQGKSCRCFRAEATVLYESTAFRKRYGMTPCFFASCSDSPMLPQSRIGRLKRLCNRDKTVSLWTSFVQPRSSFVIAAWPRQHRHWHSSPLLKLQSSRSHVFHHPNTRKGPIFHACVLLPGVMKFAWHTASIYCL
jgi:hypothetical protein